MNKLNILYLFFAVFITIPVITAQTTTPNNVTFATESISVALDELKRAGKFSDENSYYVQRSKSDKLSAFLTDAVFEYLKENRFKTYHNNRVGEDREKDLFVRIIEPMLNLDVQGGNRTLDGGFILLIYSVSDGKINRGEELSVKFEGDDNIKRSSLQYLNKFAPDFLRIERKSMFSGKKLEKVLAATVAGIITYLFYSVRG